MKFIVASVIGFLIILNAVIKVKSQICHRNWKLLDETYYLEVSTAKTFQDAKENCQQIGAELAMPKTTAQNVFLRDLTCRPPQGFYRYWIGMTDLSTENAFKWEDETFLDWGNERWAPAEPNNRWEQDCVAFIKALDEEWNGKWSTERCSSNLFSLCSKPLVLPKLSQSPTVEDIGTTSFQLRWRCWTNVEDQDDGPVLLGYHIHLTTNQNPSDADWRTVGSVLVGDTCEFLVEHLEINTEYYAAVSILHRESIREGPRGPILRVSTHDVVLPILSRSPTAEDIGKTSFQLRWHCWTNVEDQGDGPVLGYHIYLTTVQDPADADWRNVGFVLDGDPCEFFLEHLQINTEYYAAVSILHEVSKREGLRGPILLVSTHDVVLPILSRSPTVENIGKTGFQLRWHCWTNVEDQGDGPVLGYHIHLTTVQDPTDADWRTVGFVLDGDPCKFLVEHLQVNTEYYAAVSILHGASGREGPRGPVLRVSTHDVELPFLLEPPDVKDIGSSYVTISWTRWTSEVGEGDGPIAGYNVKTMNGAIWKTLVTVAAVVVDLEFNVTGLEPDTPYQFMVLVIYHDGREGPFGKILCVFTQPNEECTESGTTPFSSGDQTTQWVLTRTNPDCIRPRSNQCTTWKIGFSLLVSLCVGIGTIISIQRCRRNMTASVSRQDSEEDYQSALDYELCEIRPTNPNDCVSSNNRYINNKFHSLMSDKRTPLDRPSLPLKLMGGCTDNKT